MAIMLTGSQSVDKSIPTPLYYQLFQIIKNQIDLGELKVGDAIPTELELMEKYQISRATVRQAVLQLVNEGYLRREKSKGTFVTRPPSKFRFIEGLRGFSAEMRSRSISTYSKVLDKRIIPAPEKVARFLEIEPGAPVFYLHRLRIVDDQPFLIDHHYIPHVLCPGIEEKVADNVSLYAALEKDYKLLLHHGWREFEPVTATSKEEIDLLQIFPKTNLLYVESTVYDRDNRPINYFYALIRGKFTVDILNTSEFE